MHLFWQPPLGLPQAKAAARPRADRFRTHVHSTPNRGHIPTVLPSTPATTVRSVDRPPLCGQLQELPPPSHQEAGRSRVCKGNASLEVMWMNV
eukprot:4785461-Amphidinium_carterae.1